MNYSIIFEKLTEIGITKTRLRETVGFSTVTLAKINAGEPINLEILRKICDYLKIDISLILKQEDESNDKKWNFIKNNEYYTTILWYKLTDNNKLIYLYGYAVKSIEKVDDRDNWDIEFIKDDKVIQFKQTINCKKLLSLIDYIELNESLINYFNSNKFDINKKMSKLKLSLALLENKIMTFDNKLLCKRVLYPKSLDRNIKYSEQTQHSFSETICICYGVGVNNKLEYPMFRSDIQFYRHFFKNIVNLYDSDTDLLKIGNFEIFDFVSKDYYETKLDVKNKRVDIIFKSDMVGKMNIGNSFKIIFKGIYNDAEVINKLYEIYVNKTDYNINIELPEEIDSYELRIYKNENDNLMLVGYENEIIIKRISMNLNFEYKNVNIKGKNNKNYKFANHSTEHMQIGNNDSYVAMKDKVRLNNVYNNNELYDYYYERNEKISKDGYYTWLRDYILRFSPDEIWIFDRNLNVGLINVLLGILDNTTISIGLVTVERLRHGCEEECKNRILNLKKILQELNNKSHFRIKLYKADEEKFHDRFIFLKKMNETACFNLSNSFDDGGENYGTYLCNTSRKVGERIWEKYSELINEKNLLDSCVNINENYKLDKSLNINEIRAKYSFKNYEDVKKFIFDGNKIETEELLSIFAFNDSLKGKNENEYITSRGYDANDIKSVFDYLEYLYHNSYSYEYSIETILLEKVLHCDIDTYIKILNQFKNNNKAFEKLLLLTARVIKFSKVNSPKYYINKLLKINRYEIDILCYSFVAFNINNDFVYDADESANIDIVINFLQKCKYEEVIYEVFKRICLAYMFKINRIRSQRIDDNNIDFSIFKNKIISLVELLINIVNNNNYKLNLEICKNIIYELFKINCEITLEIVLSMLYNKNAINDELLYDICHFIIFERTGIIEYKINDYFFNEKDNKELFYVMEFIFDSKSKICKDIFNDCIYFQNKIATLLNDYFLRERNPKLWRANINGLFYLEFCKSFVKKYMQDVYNNYEDISKLSKTNFAVEDIVKHYEAYLKKYCDIYQSLLYNFEERLTDGENHI